MKTTLKLVFVIAFVALCSNVSAQNIKLAHINITELIFAMPEYNDAMEKMQKFVQGLEDEMELLQVEYNRKFDDYVRNRDNLSDIVRAVREDELNSIRQRIEIFQQQAQENMQQEQTKLIQPVFEKATKAVETVSIEQGLTWVFNSADPQFILFKAADTLDLLPAVKQHLGIRD